MQILLDNCFIIHQDKLRLILNDKGQTKVLKFLLNNTTCSYKFDNYKTLAKDIGFKTKSGVWKAIQKLKDADIIEVFYDKFYNRKSIMLKNEIIVTNDYE